LFGAGNADKFCNIVVFNNLDIHFDSVYFFSEGFFQNTAGMDLRFDEKHSGGNGGESVFWPVFGGAFSDFGILKRFLKTDNYSLDKSTTPPQAAGVCCFRKVVALGDLIPYNRPSNPFGLPAPLPKGRFLGIKPPLHE
jgi:hypothetical protein